LATANVQPAGIDVGVKHRLHIADITAPVSRAKSFAYTAKMVGLLLLISGASGTGKTSMRETIAADLGRTIEAVELRHSTRFRPFPTWRGWRITVIDASALTKSSAGHVALQWIGDAMAGRAPVFRRDHRLAPAEPGAHHST
jgi:hypothetical protein